MPLTCASPGSFTDYVEEKLLRTILGIESWAPAGPLRAALGSSTGSFEEGTFDEQSAAGYRRLVIEFEPEVISLIEGPFNICTSYTVNRYKLVWNAAQADWDVVNTLAVFTDDDIMLTWCPLEVNTHVKLGQQFILRAGDIAVGVRTSTPPYYSQFLQEQIIKYVYLQTGTVSYPLYAALSNVMPLPSTPGSAIQEPADSAYHRVIAGGWSSPIPENDGFVSSADPGAVFGVATVDWFSGAYANQVIFVDSDSGGNLLFFNHTSIDNTVLAGERAILRYCKLGLS